MSDGSQPGLAGGSETGHRRLSLRILESLAASVPNYTRQGRCWVHKTATVLDKMPKGVQGRAKSMIHDIYRAEDEEISDEQLPAFHFCIPG